MNIVQEFYWNTRSNISSRAFISWLDDWIDDFKFDNSIPVDVRDEVVEIVYDMLALWAEEKEGSDFTEHISEIERLLKLV